MRARRLIVVVVLLTAAALSGCLPKDTIKIENEESLVIDLLIVLLVAYVLREMEGLCGVVILVYRVMF